MSSFFQNWHVNQVEGLENEQQREGRTSMANDNSFPLVKGLSCLVAFLLFLLTAGTAWAQNPVPFINEPLVPDTVMPGSAGFTLVINGTGFAKGAVVSWNGSARATTFVSKSQLKATVLTSDVAKPGTASITVFNPGQGAAESNVIFFQITPPTTTVGLAATFAPAAGIDPTAVEVGDFNHDGKLDLAVANWTSNNVSVLLGNGDGTFQAAVNYAAGSGPHSVAVGDFNGDGKLDLVTANSGPPGSGEIGNTVSVLLGNGDGTFQPPVNSGAGSGPWSVAVGDFNGDGKLDLAVTLNDSVNPGAVSVLLGNGDGTFRAPVQYATGYEPGGVGVGDFNGDGKLDLVVAAGGGVNVLLGNGDGTFQAHVDYSGGGVTVGDFNGDGKLDLTDGGSMLLGNGDGTFRAPISTGGAAGGWAVVGDLNGDGKLDLVTANNNVSVLLGNGDGTFQEIDYSVIHLESLALGDFNADGRPDIAVTSTGPDLVGILLQAPTVTLSPISLGLGDEVVGRSSTSQAVTLSNTGALGLNISSIAVTGTNAADFKQADTCSSGLLPGGECRITVTFAPTQLGPRTASVAITDNAAGSPQTVALSGTGVASGPNATLSATSLTFATQLVGTPSPAQTVTLGNYGTSVLSITSIGFRGANSGDFAQSSTCGSTVAPGASCTINVTFKPTGINGRTASLSVKDNAAGSPQTTSLSGVGTVVELNPAGDLFLKTITGRSQSKSITLTNVGSTTLRISITSKASGGGLSTTQTCGPSLEAGKSCTITVTLHGGPPSLNNTLDIYVNDNGGASPQHVHVIGWICPLIGCIF
jgi:hypothetical protein